MNGDVAASSEASERRARKPRPEIQIYRPGMLRKGDSTKSLTNEEKPPRPEKLTSSEVTGGSRRRSNDTDSVTSRGGSGSTTPDANAMNDRGKRRFGANNQQTSAYVSHFEKLEKMDFKENSESSNFSELHPISIRHSSTRWLHRVQRKPIE